MGRLVMKDVHVGLHDAHEHERNDDRPPAGECNDALGHEDRGEENEQHSERVSAVVDASKLLAKLRSRASVTAEEIASRERFADRRCHATGHRRDEFFVRRGVGGRLGHIHRVPI